MYLWLFIIINSDSVHIILEIRCVIIRCNSFKNIVHPSTIACERDILKTACQIDFTF